MMRELSKLENSSSAMPPKFMGRDCDSDMRLSLGENLATKKHKRHKRDIPLCLLCLFVADSSLNYGTSMIRSLPLKVKLGRRRPFKYLAAVCDSAVITIGSAIVASQFT